MSDSSPATATGTSTTGLRLFNALTGMTTLGLLLQAVTAGEFVSQDDRDGWIAVHSVIGNVTLGIALVATVVGIAALLRDRPGLVGASALLFVLMTVQLVLGHLITDLHQDGWIGLHVPLAFLIFGGAIWISISGARARRSSTRTV